MNPFASRRLFFADRPCHPVLGGIGISNVTRVFIEQKRKAIAVLKCIGRPAEG